MHNLKTGIHMKATISCTSILFQLLVNLALAAPATTTEPENPHLWKPRVTSVTVFKNGLGFFMREGTIALRDGWCVAGEVPPAHFGTLAIFPHAQDQLVDVVGAGPGEVVEFDGVDVAKDTATKRARLEASRYLKLQLTYTQKGNRAHCCGQAGFHWAGICGARHG